MPLPLGVVTASYSLCPVILLSVLTFTSWVSSQVLGFVFLNPQALILFREVPSLAVWEGETLALTGLLPAEVDVGPTRFYKTSLVQVVGVALQAGLPWIALRLI